MTTTHSDLNAADAPSLQGFRAVMRCRWQTDPETGRLAAQWREELELFPPDHAPQG